MKWFLIVSVIAISGMLGKLAYDQHMNNEKCQSLALEHSQKYSMLGSDPAEEAASEEAVTTACKKLEASKEVMDSLFK